jgi:hypothetical protein
VVDVGIDGLRPVSRDDLVGMEGLRESTWLEGVCSTVEGTVFWAADRPLGPLCRSARVRRAPGMGLRFTG